MSSRLIAHLARRSFRMVHLEFDPSLDQAIRDLLQCCRLRAPSTELDGCRPVPGACEYRFWCCFLQQDELKFDPNEERDPRFVLRFPICVKLASVLPFVSRSEAKAENRDKVQDLSMKSAIGC